MNDSATYIVDAKKAERFIEDIANNSIQYSKKELGSGGDVRIWGIDKSNYLIKDLIAFFIENSSFTKSEIKNITAMYNIIPVGDGLNSGDGWHFDSPRTQQKCFCYLNEVSKAEHGAIRFLRFDNFLNRSLYRLSVMVMYAFRGNNRISNAYLKFLASINGKEDYVFGPTGFTFIEDTSFPHKGGELVSQPRHAVTLYYFEKDPDWLSYNQQRSGKT